MFKIPPETALEIIKAAITWIWALIKIFWPFILLLVLIDIFFVILKKRRRKINGF